MEIKPTLKIFTTRLWVGLVM